MSTYARAVAEDRRLAILRILADSMEYKSNIYLLQRVLTSIGHAMSFDALKTEISWLTEQGLIESETVGGMPIPTLISRGLDVAAGRSVVPGVARPMPE